VHDDELAAIIAALHVYAQQHAEQPPEKASAWKLAARREDLRPFDKLRMTRRV
jgi:hypothetical protein